MPVSRPVALGSLAALIAAAFTGAPGPGRAQAPVAGLAKAMAAPTASTTAAVSNAGASPTAARKPAARRPSRAAPAASPAEPGVLHVDLSTAGGSARSLNLPFGKSALVELPSDARDVLVTNPAVADAVLRGRRQISILGVAPGDTDAVFFDEAGKRMLTLDIHVAKDSSGLAAAIGRVLPGAQVRVESVNDSLVLAGEVASSADAQKAVLLAQHFVAKPEQVVNLLTITGKEQVMLKVRVVELQRTIIKQLGFNLDALTGQLGMPQYSFGNAASFGVNGGFLGGARGGYSLNTTSQAVSPNPFSGLGAAAQGMGVPPMNAASVVSQFLTGAGALTAAQQAFSKTFLSNLIGTVQTQVTNVVTDPKTGVDISGAAHTVTAASAGISQDNIAQFEQRYLAGDTTLTGDQRSWMNNFNTQLQTQAGVVSGQNIVDRNNPLATVQNNLAGSSSLNQAQAMIQAFERVGLVRTLAEPNLTAVSGESAKFLAGGEYPVPTGSDNTGRVSIEFKPYGVGLNFTPVVMSGGRISMKISTEVSELSNDGAFTISAGANAQITIPALKLRRTETTVELPSGGAMMIAGLLQQQSKQNLDSLPGLKDLPVLGALFRSRDYLSGETELAIIVTPYVVQSTSPDQLQTPIDGLQFADDLTTNLLGKLNKASNVPPAAVAGKSLQGPYGYVIE
jgi:pilus assembly protein CpaC